MLMINLIKTNCNETNYGSASKLDWQTKAIEAAIAVAVDRMIMVLVKGIIPATYCVRSSNLRIGTNELNL